MSRECQETGEVVTLHGRDRAQVKIRRVDACDTCDAKGACRALGGGARSLVVDVENTLGAEVGDLVVLGMPEVNVVKASAAVYLVPAAGLIGGAYAGWRFGGMDGDGFALLGALAGLLLGFGLARLWSGRLARDPQYIPTLVRVMGKSEGTPS